MENAFYVSSSPHIADRESIPRIMYSVSLSLLPAAGYAVYLFGFRALLIMLLSMAACVATEAAAQKLMKRPVTINDGSALLTGLLLAFNVSAQVPLWLPVVGGVFAIAVGKQVFGGLGYNPMNPALLGRAFLLASWPTHMTVFSGAVPQGSTVSGIDVITSATPLNLLKQAKEVLAHAPNYPVEKVNQAHEAVGQLYDSIDKIFLGQIGGCIGETSALLLIIGGLFLLYKRYIGWEIPASYIGSVALLAWIFGGTEGLFSGNILFHVFAGGLMLGAFYMATDMVTSPITRNGRLIFGFGCGLITMVIRLVGGYPEGVSYSILLMNLLVPMIDRSVKPKVFGGGKKQ
jgi:Na+-translocating ferredoxin:NAD+ oxidoreductase subunit D